MSYAERLQAAIDASGLTVRQFAEKIHVTTQAVYKTLRGESKSLRADHHLRACRALRVSPQWLSDGVGPMQADTPVALRDNPDFPEIKMVDIKIDAGQTGYLVSQIDSDSHDPIVFRAEWFKSRGYTPGRLVAIKVSGASMEPTLYDRDVVVINLDDTTPKDGEVYAWASDGALVVKRAIKDGDWWMVSDNPDGRRYPRKTCGEGVEIIGRIVHRQSERM